MYTDRKSDTWNHLKLIVSFSDNLLDTFFHHYQMQETNTEFIQEQDLSEEKVLPSRQSHAQILLPALCLSFLARLCKLYCIAPCKVLLTDQKQSYFSFFCNLLYRDSSRDPIFHFDQSPFDQVWFATLTFKHKQRGLPSSVKSFNKLSVFP